ncbi:hypothetical protein [Marisediminicola sp. LYQ85]|uniref:hypothetical protein n=1 Tax=Marisediminicola sp. LYQ85 TaxID=3391062 RepID=UPI003982F3B5
MRVRDVAFNRTQQFDILVATCGYERRSSYLARLGVAAARKLAVVYPGTVGLSFASNRAIYEAEAWDQVAERELLDELARELHGAVHVSLCIDVSSMARRTIANMVELVSEHPNVGVVQFVYCPARYETSARAAAVVRPLSAGPITPYFSGTLRSPSIPIGLIVGLGLEPHRADGLIELLEPSRLWSFVASSEDERFATDVLSMHSSLLGGTRSVPVSYDVHSLSDIYSSLDSLVFSAGLRYRLLIAPSGPKIFGLAALLVGANRSDSRPAIWRVGVEGAIDAPIDVLEAGDVVSAVVTLSDHIDDA